MRGDVFSRETFREVFEVLTPALGIWGVVEGDEDGVVVDADIAIEAAQELLGEWTRFIIYPRETETLTQLVQGGLRDERHVHLGITDIKVHRAGMFPTQVLRGMEEFFDVPSFWVVEREGLDFISVGGAKEGFEDMGVGGLTGALNELDQRQVGEMVKVKGLFCGGPTDPRGGEGAGRNGAQCLLIGGLIGHGDKQVEKRVFPDVLEQFARPVFGIGEHQGTKRLGVKDVGGQLQEFGSGLSDGTGR